MNLILTIWEQLVEAIKWWVGIAMVLIGLYKAYQAYLEAQILKAKEKSVGEQALKRVDSDIELIEKELDKIRASTSDYGVLKILVEKLRDDYKFIMERLFPIKPAK